MQQKSAATLRSLIVLVFVHLALAMPLAFSLNIWADEASSLFTTEQGFWHAFDRAAVDERQAPLYFWLLSIWRQIDSSIFFARCFSVFASILAIAVVYYFARKYLSDRVAILTAAFIALHPYLIWASNEIRGYALVILLSSLLISIFFQAFQGEQFNSLKWKIVFIFTAVISLYTNYYLAFILAGCFVLLIVEGRWKSVIEYSLMMLITLIGFVPGLTELRRGMVVNSPTYAGDSSLIDGILTIWNSVLTFLLPTEIFPPLEQTMPSFIRLWIVRSLIVVVIFAVIKQWSSISAATVRLFMITVAVVAGLLIAGSLIGVDFILIRHASVLFIPLILLTASLLRDLFSNVEIRTTKMISLAFGVLILLSFSYSLRTLYPNMAKPGDWLRVGAFIQENESPGQPIVIFPTFYRLALPYNYHGRNNILPDSRFFDFAYEAPSGSPDAFKRQIEFTVSQIPTNSDEIWLATADMCQTTDECLPLENFITEHYTTILDQQFYLERLRLLKRKR